MSCDVRACEAAQRRQEPTRCCVNNLLSWYVTTLRGLLKASKKPRAAGSGLRPSSGRRNGNDEEGDAGGGEKGGRREGSRYNKAAGSLGARAADQVARVSP